MRCPSPDTIGTHTHCQPLHAWDQTSCDVGRQVAMETLLSLLMSSALLLTFGTDQLLLGHAETPVDQHLKLEESLFHGTESVRLVECTANIKGMLSTRLWDLNSNNTYVYSSLSSEDCIHGALWSKCLIKKKEHTASLQILIENISSVVALGCKLTYSHQGNDESLTRYLNVSVPERITHTTQELEREGAVSTTPTVGRSDTVGSSNFFDEGALTTIVMVIASLLVIFIALFVVVLCILIRARKQQQAGASRDFELMSFRRSFGGGSYDRDHHTLKRHVSCPPPACSPPDTPASVLVMPYQRPLPLSSDGMTYRENGNHGNNLLGQYQEPWSCLDNDFSNRLTTFRPNPVMCYLPGFEGTMMRGEPRELLEDNAGQ
ncbi:hypothetical protein C0Q70_12667 [Pomacea canaliculata]|uniref:Uncharacterized protein n=1 Tax=Pomacea canaliculata TaxID=400727 RepID=A0A2T7P251_POMCA|nr:uncharacterized protein LOC112568994 isoform X2 [Pomacea canaliculata]PVD27505.1 hypothetical protein C0Q70_12667 [Pomacea canaliculata]